VPRLRIVDVIAVLEMVIIVCRRVGSSTPQHNAMLVAGHAIGVVERFARIGARIEIGLAAPRIPFVVRVRPGCSNDHVSASG
jgi:hypothetical protein